MKLFGEGSCGGFYFMVAIDEENQLGCLMLLGVFELHSDYPTLGNLWG